jgi:hypothetical protein
MEDKELILSFMTHGERIGGWGEGEWAHKNSLTTNMAYYQFPILYSKATHNWYK